MKKEDFKEWYRPEYMESVEKIIEQGGNCHGVYCGKCPLIEIFNCVSSAELKYVRIRNAKDFKAMVEWE